MNYSENGKIFDIFVLFIGLVARLNYRIKIQEVVFLFDNHKSNGENAGELNF